MLQIKPIEFLKALYSIKKSSPKIFPAICATKIIKGINMTVFVIRLISSYSEYKPQTPKKAQTGTILN
mgnify:CR=1 FL=1